MTDEAEQCLLHTCDVEGPIKSLNVEKWGKISTSAKRWLKCCEEGAYLNDRMKIAQGNPDLWDKPLSEISNKCGAHSQCFSAFTHKGHLESAEKSIAGRKRRSQEAVVPDVRPSSSEPKKTRSSSITIGKGRSSHILPKTCIICGKRSKWCKQGQKRTEDVLNKCETYDAGQYEGYLCMKKCTCHLGGASVGLLTRMSA